MKEKVAREEKERYKLLPRICFTIALWELKHLKRIEKILERERYWKEIHWDDVDMRSDADIQQDKETQLWLRNVTDYYTLHPPDVSDRLLGLNNLTVPNQGTLRERLRRRRVWQREKVDTFENFLEFSHQIMRDTLSRQCSGVSHIRGLFILPYSPLSFVMNGHSQIH